jgi:hypothetical protein
VGRELVSRNDKHHDGAAREFAYDRHAQSRARLDKLLDEAKNRHWLIVSMKSDFKTIFSASPKRWTHLQDHLLSQLDGTHLLNAAAADLRIESTSRDQSSTFAASGRVMNSDRCKIAGAATITIGSIKTQATAHDRSQCPRNPAAQMRLKLAIAAAIELVRADCIAANKKCA